MSLGDTTTALFAETENLEGEEQGSPIARIEESEEGAGYELVGRNGPTTNNERRQPGKMMGICDALRCAGLGELEIATLLAGIIATAEDDRLRASTLLNCLRVLRSDGSRGRGSDPASVQVSLKHDVPRPQRALKALKAAEENQKGKDT
jgi:hypothetical protein